MRRTVSESAALIAAYVVAVVFASAGVAVVGSYFGLPLPALAVLAVVAAGVMAYPVFLRRRAERSGGPAPSGPAVSRETSPGPAASSETVSSPVASSPSTSATLAAARIEEDTMSDNPLVAVIMGSQSDMAVMEECTQALAEFGVPYEVTVASAHRQPEKVHLWASTLAGRGVKVVIAAAGKAAHLGGVVAAFTPLPVVTVPMKTSDLGGLDSLLSMVQMPTGVPVACVAINGARNAAVLALQILGTSMPEFRERVVALKQEMAQG
jgi:5-(carboxyamino)imidazole ribonucleotide mutase